MRSTLRSFAVAAFFLYLGFSLRAQAPAVVRLSYVNGTVQVLQDGNILFEKAVVNMPLFSGYSLATQDDGEAEIEFADGSVARLTPDSSLLLTHLEPAGPSSHSTLELSSGLGYFELNVGQGQSFSVKTGPATATPRDNSIFRVNLDGVPELAVFQGSLHVDGGAGNAADVNDRQAIRFAPGAGGGAGFDISESITPDSWDQWNVDRDAAIAGDAQGQTSARNQSAAPGDPGWNDLDANGNWYPVPDYGDVWVPDGTDASFDPFGYGYWGAYPGYGSVWVSGYPWGWLPYHCGAWNYFQFGWGWVPGGCGLGFSPVVSVWNAPPGYRLPPRPPHPIAMGNRPHAPVLTPVDRGAAARGPWAGSGMSGVKPGLAHAAALQSGQVTLQPLRRGPVSNMIVMPTGAGSHVYHHVGVPGPGGPMSNQHAPVGARLPVRQDYAPLRGINSNPRYENAPAVQTPARPTYTPPPPRYEAPAPPYEAPAQHSSPPPPPAAAPSHPH